MEHTGAEPDAGECSVGLAQLCKQILRIRLGITAGPCNIKTDWDPCGAGRIVSKMPEIFGNNNKAIIAGAEGVRATRKRQEGDDGKKADPCHWLRSPAAALHAVRV